MQGADAIGPRADLSFRKTLAGLGLRLTVGGYPAVPGVAERGLFPQFFRQNPSQMVAEIVDERKRRFTMEGRVEMPDCRLARR